MEMQDANNSGNKENPLKDDNDNQIINDKNNNDIENIGNYEKSCKDCSVEEEIFIERNLKDDTVYDKSIKVILLGDTNVGKSSIIRRLRSGVFEDDLTATISIEYYNYAVRINDFVIRMQLWDTVGQELYHSIVSNYYRSTDVAIFVYSIDNKNSFENIQKWFKEINEKNSKTENSISKNILLGNKKDLQRIITYEQGEKYAKENNFLFFNEISCKNSENEEIDNIIEVFDIIAKVFYDEHMKKKNTTIDFSLNYVASKSIIELGSDKSGETKGKKRKKERNERKCC